VKSDSNTFSRGCKKDSKMARRQCRLLRRELRHAENLNIPEEVMV
jgi:hypothetical protein